MATKLASTSPLSRWMNIPIVISYSFSFRKYKSTNKFWSLKQSVVLLSQGLFCQDELIHVGVASPEAMLFVWWYLINSAKCVVFLWKWFKVRDRCLTTHGAKSMVFPQRWCKLHVVSSNMVELCMERSNWTHVGVCLLCVCLNGLCLFSQHPCKIYVWPFISR